ncbi:hypothetical protein N7474_010801 [Penicillium riverlandense]|uniref:uncharacterized protein n=1 Tax=Penicillium riverlandense TaxID=1903569 RepID=UPI002547C63B|nr:uncharacterized protein N7474_010801 [Penicillium riverlandense]KAJ5804914.1 hypothetical protein N7474_010801 [Penicillium riverlandense]
MSLHGILRTAVALAVASMIPMVAGTTAQSTEVDIIFPALISMNLDYVEGSVVSAGASATTIEIDCRSSATNQCLSSGYILPQTLTTGPSFQDFHYDITSYYNSTIYIVTGTLDCNLTSSTLGASCYASTSTWISSGLNATSSAWSTSISISSFNLKYNTLTVASGLGKLPTVTAATNASPRQTVTSTSTPTTTTNAATTSKHRSSSKAWIAGPVVGVVVGLALLAAAAFWYISRRRKRNADPMGGNPSEGISEVSEHQAHLPVQNSRAGELPAQIASTELSVKDSQAGELSAKSARSELSAQYNPHELP